jgi:hypothetical protein
MWNELTICQVKCVWPQVFDKIGIKVCAHTQRMDSALYYDIITLVA